VLRPEKCKKCRKWFQFSQLADCKVGPGLEKYEKEEVWKSQDANFSPACFHEVDLDEKEMFLCNKLKKGEYEVFAREVQVVDNIKQSWFRTARDRDKDKKGKN